MTKPAPKHRLGDLVRFVSGGTPSKQNAAFWGGVRPWVSAKDLKMLRITSSIDRLTEEGLKGASLVTAGTVLILVRGMTLFKSIPVGIAMQEMAINQDLKGLVPNEHISPYFLAYALLARQGTLLNMVEAAGHGTGRLDTDALKELMLRVPTRSEQDRIVDTLDTWETGIEKTEQLIATKKKRNRISSNQLLFGHARFGGKDTQTTKSLHWFSAPSDWRVVEIGEIASEVSSFNSGKLGQPVLSCTKYDGLVNSLEYFDKQVFSHNTSKYKVVKRGQFAYATNHIEEGSIGYQDLVPAGLVSPIYTVFKTDTSTIDDGYLYKLLKTEKLRQIFAANTNASVDRRGSLRWKEFARIQIPLPPIDEQRQISAALDTEKHVLVLLRKQVDALRKQRRGLLQKLLAGEWRLQVSVLEAAK